MSVTRWDDSHAEVKSVYTAFIASLVWCPLHAQNMEGEDYPVVETIHSDLPLYSFEWDELWPRGIVEPDTLGGCASRIRFGDWKFAPHADNEYHDGSWYRFSNYGVLHCAAILEAADKREELDEASFEYGYFVRIGGAKVEGRKWELWAIQEGAVPGSQYTLLARRPSDQIASEFRVLQQICAAHQIRELEEGLDIWSTRYCAINSRKDLLALAERMLGKKPVGTIKLVPDEEGPDETPDPSD